MAAAAGGCIPVHHPQGASALLSNLTASPSAFSPLACLCRLKASFPWISANSSPTLVLCVWVLLVLMRFVTACQRQKWASVVGITITTENGWLWGVLPSPFEAVGIFLMEHNFFYDDRIVMLHYLSCLSLRLKPDLVISFPETGCTLMGTVFGYDLL